MSRMEHNYYIGEAEDDSYELRAVSDEGLGEVVDISSAQGLGRSMLSTEIKQAVTGQHPNYQLLEQKVQETLSLLQEKGRLDLSDSRAIADIRLPLNGMETLEMLLSRGIITRQMYEEKRVGLNAIVFARLHHDRETKNLINGVQKEQVIALIEAGIAENSASQKLAKS